MDYQKSIPLPSLDDPLAFLRDIQELFRFTYNKTGYYHLTDPNILCISTTGTDYFISVAGRSSIVFIDAEGKRSNKSELRIAGKSLSEVIQNFVTAIQSPAYCEVIGHEKIYHGTHKNFLFWHSIRIEGNNIVLFNYMQTSS